MSRKNNHVITPRPRRLMGIRAVGFRHSLSAGRETMKLPIVILFIDQIGR